MASLLWQPPPGGFFHSTGLTRLKGW